MTSLPPGECCVTGITHEGTPQGKMENINNTETYIVQPVTSTDKAIILFSDFFGPHYPNTQLIADRFALKGYLTVVPDLWKGDPVQPSEFAAGKVDLQKWGAKHGTETTDPIIDGIFEYLKKDLKIEHLAGVGYCLGAKYVVRNLKDSRLNVGYIAHPSFVTSEELSAVTKPLTIAAAEIDHLFPFEKRVESEKIIASLSIPWQINVYGGVEHGFALKGDLTKKEVQFATDQAFDQAVSWFRYHL